MLSVFFSYFFLHLVSNFHLRLRLFIFSVKAIDYTRDMLQLKLGILYFFQWRNLTLIEKSIIDEILYDSCNCVQKSNRKKNCVNFRIFSFFSLLLQPKLHVKCMQIKNRLLNYNCCSNYRWFCWNHFKAYVINRWEALQSLV